MKPITYGYGDAATWSACDGHPGDPRTEPPREPETELEAYDAAMAEGERLVEHDLAFRLDVDKLTDDLVAKWGLPEPLAETLWEELSFRRHEVQRSRNFLAAFYGIKREAA